MLAGATSTKSALAAPRDSASRPRAPEPAKRSSTRAPGSSGCTMLIHASRARSPVGRTRSSRGALMVRPRHSPAMIRTSANVREPGDQPRRIPPEVAFESIGDIHHLRRAPFGGPMRNTPPDTLEFSGVVAQRELETVLPDHTRRRAEPDAARGEQRRRIPDPERLEVTQQFLERIVRVAKRNLEIDAQLRREVVF